MTPNHGSALRAAHVRGSVACDEAACAKDPDMVQNNHYSINVRSIRLKSRAWSATKSPFIFPRCAVKVRFSGITNSFLRIASVRLTSKV
jgi:hypothetical protein